MKKILYVSIAMLLFLSSCQKDDSLIPTPPIVDGNYMRLDITKKRLNFNDLANTSFGGALTNPGGKVVKYNLYVRRTDIYGSSYGDFKLVKTITSFPTDLSVTPQDIATALGVAPSVFQIGDVFRFWGEAFDANGNRYDYYSLSSTIQGNKDSYKEAYLFGTDMTDNSGMVQSELNVFDNYIPQ